MSTLTMSRDEIALRTKRWTRLVALFGSGTPSDPEWESDLDWMIATQPGGGVEAVWVLNTDPGSGELAPSTVGRYVVDQRDEHQGRMLHDFDTLDALNARLADLIDDDGWTPVAIHDLDTETELVWEVSARVTNTEVTEAQIKQAADHLVALLCKWNGPALDAARHLSNVENFCHFLNDEKLNRETWLSLPAELRALIPETCVEAH